MKNLLFFAAILLVGLTVSAQTDFSGKWKLNKSTSVLNQEFTMAPGEIIIAQNGNEFKVERHASFQGNEFTINDKFTLDGKECINDGWADSKKKSTAIWGEGEKMLTITTKFPMRDSGEMTVDEIFSLDGTSLVIKTKASSSYGVVEEKQVFDKE